jgi:transglutaminase-like putative cysteine protease
VNQTTRAFRVAHRTSYAYGATMTDGYSVACLTPRTTAHQSVTTTDVEVVPPPAEIDTTTDVFGNRVHQFGLHQPHDAMAVTCESEVLVQDRPDPVDPTPWEDVVELCASATGDLAIEVGMFRSSCSLVDLDVIGAALAPMVGAIALPGAGIIDVARGVCAAINDRFGFDPHFSNVSTPLTEVLAARRGVCQDFAHVAVGCLRSIGLAARYVSGYIETVPPPGQARLIGADASHAWASVWTPNAGWVDFDPTNAHLPVNDHITVAWGRDYADVIPVRGVMIGPAADQALTVAVDVVRV